MTTQPTRRQIILTLLDHLQDYETPPGRNNNPDDGPGIPLMPAMWHHPSVQKLHTTLANLLVEDRWAWIHLNAYYRAETRITREPQRVRNRHGRPIHPPRWEPGPPQAKRILPPNLNPETVRRAQNWVIDNYPGTPYLPNELRTELAASA